MRSYLAILFLLILLPAVGQDRIASVNALMKELISAPMDAGRDSLNLVLKKELNALLEQEDALEMSLEGLRMSRIDAPDGSFRLITWNVPRENGSHLYEGYLLHAKGRKLELYELRDMTPEITSPEVPEMGPDRWYGALYYEVVPVKRGGKTYFTLLGWKGHDQVETRKVVDVLHFKGGKPRFGAPIFGEGRLKKSRLVYGYSFQATMNMRYEEGRGIVMDHLSPSRQDLEGQWAFYGPDMSHDALVWDRDHWRLERDIDARERTKNNRPFNAPPPSPRP